jgi:5-methylcytosine-specific restriction endonuclease McrA
LGLGEGATRDDFSPVLAEIEAARREEFGPRPKAAYGEGARVKILQHFRAHVGEEIYGEELLSISGIQEWARRIRELRVENGYDIRVVGPSTYVMLTPDPDEDRAHRWQLAHRIRTRKGSARNRIARFLTESVGEVINRDQIDYVGKIKEGSRRVRELRDEEGWPIETHVDDPTLRPSEYRLVSIDPNDRRESSQRLYDDALRQQIFERDDYRCQVCGRNKESAEAAGDRRFYLELHHKVAIADELSELSSEERNEPSNLVTLCHSDHLRETEQMQKAKRTRRTRSR